MTDVADFALYSSHDHLRRFFDPINYPRKNPLANGLNIPAKVDPTFLSNVGEHLHS
ncbi:hypothetical protein LEP1GSC036_3106 [Leptospira weilii str. 2006001853]|uniref:Uncharacterized protein n=3 Tax=Leptospira weilii TaxID=28184 RepID=A0A828YYL3_9LEPT|nr:hypothetical protein LEP1GSC036_3106 [Leptospira weilii str. 2006001853]EMJ66050.1 hypothetical protein LEP1GSC051_3511 [Leptospira sp. P2653]EMM72503.1 hypothetical protein LEP1GSC038_3284 [Leptospira weilii str. 2006001855]EMN43475.1 hypothetical protein LEP1GSC086_0546 [Leptospira weilii str. LNT 1234]EMN90960.1 hypothetical protein LEP1GSC108_4278 [Leptospira weilii str. UI 13098]